MLAITYTPVSFDLKLILLELGAIWYYVSVPVSHHSKLEQDE